MRALVTGASGFVGPHLCAHLRSEGDEVIATDRSAEVELDVTDPKSVRAVLRRERPEIVYHLAALAHVGDSWGNRREVLRVNVEGTANVLAAASEAHVRRVVVVGSAEEYGRVDPDAGPLTETASLRPATPYGASKVAASFLALQASVAGEVETVRIRPFNHTGPGQAPSYLVPALAHRIAQAEREGADDVAVGSLDPVRDLSDVRDVVRAYRALAVAGESGDVYNVCSGRGVTVREVAQILVAGARRPLQLVPDPALVRTVDVARLVGDPTKLRAVTGWTPRYDLATTLADVLDDARRAVYGP